MFESRRNTWDCVCAQERSQSRVYGSGLQHKSKRTTLVGIFFRPPDQLEIDEAFFRQSGETWFSQALLIVFPLFTGGILLTQNLMEGQT